MPENEPLHKIVLPRDSELEFHDDPVLDEQSRQRLLYQFGQRAGWNDPVMNVYDDLIAEGEFDSIRDSYSEGVPQQSPGS